MNVLFCHDGPLKRDENGKFYGIAHNNSTFKRYYVLGEKLNVAIRVNEVLKKEAILLFSQISISPFHVFKCPNLLSLKGLLTQKKKAKKIVNLAIENSNFVIARLPSMIGFLAVDLAKSKNKPYLIESVACPWDGYWNHSLKGKLVAPFMYFATKKRIKNAPYVLYVTNEFLQKRYPTTGKSIGCSDVALPVFNDSILNARLKKINSLKPNDKIIIGTTAAVNVKYKGQQYIIKALGKLKKQGITNYEYQLVGAGDQSFLKSMAKKYNVSKQVVFLGALPHNKVFDWLDSIDLYVQPSRQEGLPRALIEAMSRGLPAFGAKTAGIPELLEPKFIFSNTRKNIIEICNILKTFDKEMMLIQAKRNFEEAKNYDSNVIEKRRKAFFSLFKNESLKK
jgi:glycosyltransferase involved in cell wall biosynthesis